ncbi:MAG: AI-2E family transporter, partial [Planctomycetota bacterium]|nr:AI-2E family transporter [Planctomycetota bacterium]
NTKVGFIYTEAADNIRDFGRMLGRALEAQLLIALCNTALTALGLWFLGLTANLVFISTIVFFCSFIPVAGVFLSSAPICLEALSQEGFGLMLAAVAMILIVHFIEAYFLNPKIFGHKLHMNAVLVLIVLTIAGKLVGVWGLILGLPIVNYLFGHAIRYRESRQQALQQPEST